MKNILVIGGKKSVISFVPEIEKFRGCFVGLSEEVEFYASSVIELKREGELALEIFTQSAQQSEMQINKFYSGNITVRLAPDVHKRLEWIAIAEDLSINRLLNDGALLILKKYFN